MASLLQTFLAPGTRLPRGCWVVVALVLGVLGWCYFTAAVAHGDRYSGRIDRALAMEASVFYGGDKEAMEKAGRPTHAYDLNDHRVYMNYAKGMREFHYDLFVTRMRMPMFMWALSLAADDTPRKTDDASLEAFYQGFYPTARAFNVGLSLLLLGVMFLALRPWLGVGYGIAFTLVAGAQLFVLKSAYVQPELLQTAIITITVAWVTHALRRPSWRSGLIAGLLLCLWHMTKANALVALGLMGAAQGVQLLVARDLVRRKAVVITGLVALVAYLVPMSPYLHTSWKTFGDPFYNVQSKFYMWATDVDAKHLLQRSGLDRNLDAVDLDRDGKIDHPERLPSAGKYWREHTWKSIKLRLRKGITVMFENAFEEYTALHWLQVFWAGLVVWAVARRWDVAVGALRDWAWPLAYACVLLTVFAYLFGWFTPLRVGPRLVNSISLVPLVACMAMVRGLLRGDEACILGRRFATDKLVLGLALITWVGLTAIQLPPDLAVGYFGG